mgnify:CR=1 FL=1
MRQTSSEPSVQARNRESAESLRLAITRTARKLRQEAGSDLTPTALATLASVERHGPVSPTRLAEVESVKRPTITRITSQMVEDGLLDRSDDPEDGRSCRLEVTPQGAAYLEEHRSRKSAYLARLLDSLSVEQAKTLEEAAAILDRALREGIGEGVA